jgi:gamma-glutamylcyclotransferase (GGCT)/AIG2-like uncharacterized protein YtfP
VYGTLRYGQGNWEWALNHPSIEYLGTDRIEGYALYQHGIPFMVESEGDSVVVDVFDVGYLDVWTALDSLEGHPDWYRREIMTTEGGTSVWCYLYPRATGEELESRGLTKVQDGDWVGDRS